MIRQQGIHAVQVSILDTLRHAPAASFTQLMQPTGLTSDVFKFHIRSLLKASYILKQANGQYQLSASGKEYANNLDKERRLILKQPKLSVLVFANRQSTSSEQQYLFQKRSRKPYFGYWSVIGGPVRWGEEIETTAASELHKQTGLQASLKIDSFYRKQDYMLKGRNMLEDKLFVLVTASNLTGNFRDTWHGGQNRWMTLDEFRAQPCIFEETLTMITMLKEGRSYHSSQAFYSEEQY